MEKLEALEATLHEREQYLSFLQNEEADRQLKVIGERALIRAASAAPIAAPSVDSNQQSMLLVENGKEYLTTPVRQRTPLSGLVTFASPLKSPAEAMLSIAQNEVLVCVECRITPTSHKCRRCRRYVCDVCCFRERGLEMIWWCAE